MTEPIKPRIDFTEPPLSDAMAPLRPAQRFDDAPFDPILTDEGEGEGQAERLLASALRPARHPWRRLIGAGVLLLVLSALAQGVLWLMRAWQQQEWLALGALLAGAMIVLAGIGSLAAEWRRLYRLRQRSEERDRAGELLASDALGEGRTFCLRLAAQAGIGEEHPALRQWQAALQQCHSDREVLTLYAAMVQPAIDRRVRRLISQSAAESALMVAVSPLAIVDMAFIAWRSLRLVKGIASLYGIEVGYFSRIRLFRLVLFNVAFAGISEWVREAGMDWMSQDLTARLSARIAQGMGAGLLTARLGIKAMELCRPLPWIDGDKPRLGDYRRELLGQLKGLLSRRPGQEDHVG